MAWVKDITGNLVNLNRCGLIRKYQLHGSHKWSILVFSEGTDEAAFSILSEFETEKEANAAMFELSNLVMVQKIEIGTLN